MHHQTIRAKLSAAGGACDKSRGNVIIIVISMSLWSIGKDRTLKSVSKSKLNFENDLENWIIDDPTILDLDLMGSLGTPSTN